MVPGILLLFCKKRKPAMKTYGTFFYRSVGVVSLFICRSLLKGMFEMCRLCGFHVEVNTRKSRLFFIIFFFLVFPSPPLVLHHYNANYYIITERAAAALWLFFRSIINIIVARYDIKIISRRRPQLSLKFTSTRKRIHAD